MFYTPRANRQGIYENAVVFWELFGPRDEDYRVLLSDGIQPAIARRGGSIEVAVTFGIRKPGPYRLRAAVVDEAGRSTVVWKTLTGAW